MPMLDLQQISDRLELQQLIVEYASAIDSKQFDRLDDVFTPDAYIDYRVFGGIDGRYPEIKAWLKQVLTPMPAFQHLIGNVELRIEEDAASGPVMCLNPTAFRLADGAVQVGFYGLWYIDRYVRAKQAGELRGAPKRKPPAQSPRVSGKLRSSLRSAWQGACRCSPRLSG